MFQNYAKSTAAMQDIPDSKTDCERDFRLSEGRDKELYRFLLILLNIRAYDDDTKTASEFFLTWDILEDAMPFLKSLGIYIIGGFAGDNALDSVLRYDTTTNTWNGVASMPTARCCHGTCVHGDFVYVIGGEDGGNALDSVLRYDTTTNTWNGVASMPTARSRHRVV